MVFAICEFLNTFVGQAIAATIWQSRTEFTDLIPVASSEETASSMSTKQELLLLWSIKRNKALLPNRRFFFTDNLNNNSGQLLAGQLTVNDVHPVEDRALREEIVIIMFKHKILLSRRLKTIKATHYTINLRNGTRSICQQPCCEGPRFKKI